MTIPDTKPLHSALKALRGECDAYSLDLGSLRTSAGRLVDAAVAAAQAARALGAHDVGGQFDSVASGIGETRIKLADLHHVSIALAAQVAKVTRDFDIASRKVK